MAIMPASAIITWTNANIGQGIPVHLPWFLPLCLHFASLLYASSASFQPNALNSVGVRAAPPHFARRARGRARKKNAPARWIDVFLRAYGIGALQPSRRAGVGWWRELAWRKLLYLCEQFHAVSGVKSKVATEAAAGRRAPNGGRRAAATAAAVRRGRRRGMNRRSGQAPALP